MLSINDLSLQYGSKHIFRNVSAQIHSGDRVGLAGVNGSGKSTLLKIMCGQHDIDPGIVSRAGWFSVAYLPQEVSIDLGSRTLFAEAESAFNDVLAQQGQMDRIGEQLAEPAAGLVVVELSPSWPFVFSPQAQTVPSPRTASECV